jgi:hypothetical protein
VAACGERSGRGRAIILVFLGGRVCHNPIYLFDRVAQAILTPRRTEFIPRPMSVGFVVNKVALGLNFSEC